MVYVSISHWGAFDLPEHVGSTAQERRHVRIAQAEEDFRNEVGINVLCLNTKTHNRLLDFGMRTIGRVRALIDLDDMGELCGLRHVPGIGKKSQKEIRDQLRKHDLGELVV